MKYTQRQWDREVGWGKVPKEYSMENWSKQFDNEKLPTKLDEYKAKINYDVWADVTNVKYNMKVNYNVHPQTSDTTKTDNRDNKSLKILCNTRGKQVPFYNHSSLYS